MNKLLDELGLSIDLGTVDAIGRLPDGRFELWLDDDRRRITDHPETYEIWINYLRSKNKPYLNTATEITREAMMQANTHTTKQSINEIVEGLVLTEDRFENSYHTASDEQYRKLVKAALDGKLDGEFSVGRSGVYLNKMRINPPPIL